MMKSSKQMKKATASLLAAVMVMQATPSFAAESYKDRGDVPAQYKWDLTDMYKSDKAFQDDLFKVENVLIPKVLTYKGKLTDKESVLACLQTQTEMMRTVYKVYMYAYQSSDVNMGDEVAQKNLGLASKLFAKTTGELAFIDTELLSNDEKKIREYKNDPSLKDYTRYFDMLLNRKQHVLSEAEEKILANASILAGSPNNIYSKLVNFDMASASTNSNDGDETQATQLSGQGVDREMRKVKDEKRLDGYAKNINTLAATLEAEVNKNIFFATSSKYGSALEAALASQEVPTSVYENLINTTNKNLAPLQRYISLRKKILKVDKVHAYDMGVDLMGTYKFDRSYEDAKKIMIDGLAPLGSAYGDVVKKALNENWIDVYATPQRLDSEYSWSAYDVHPFVLMSYTGDFDDVSSLAYELGTTISTYCASKTQPYDKAKVSGLAGSVAATTNEIMVTKYLIDHAKTNKEKLFLMNGLIGIYQNIFYEQVLGVEFEQEIHKIVEQGDTLTPETLNALWKELESKYYGADYEVDDYASVEWATNLLFYRNFFTCQFPIGMAAANELSQNILDKKPGAVEDYQAFLNSGNSYDPIRTLKNAGVNMNTQQPIDNVIKEFDSLVTDMEKLMKEEGMI